MVIFLIFIISTLPPGNIRVCDTPNDGGHSITIRWDLSPDDRLIDGYYIYRATVPETTFVKIGMMGQGVTFFEDDRTDDSKSYQYRVGAGQDTAVAFSSISGIVKSSPQFFHTGRLNVLIGLFIFAALVFYYIHHVKEGKKIFVRKIPGLAAVEEAIGRATEMGKPILYVPGLGDVDYTATIASMGILGEVAKKVAQYETPLLVVNRMPVVYTVSKEVVKEAYASVGRPDAFKEEYVRFLTDSQFGYAAAVDGLIVREKPATNFFIGHFWAEALILAETGSHSGAIQIAGTDSVMQLPFFITACDYTLIGEELYAASAYLSQNPILLSALRAQDYGKLLTIVLLILFTGLSLIFGLNVLSLLGVY